MVLSLKTWESRSLQGLPKTHNLSTKTKITKAPAQCGGFCAFRKHIVKRQVTVPPFTADCEKCFGLCCTALSFERSDQFGHDKLGGQPCQFLQSDFRCRIHARREDLGYGGCEAFDCLGAGQKASAAFAALNWRNDSGVARRLYARFSQLLLLQEMRQALETAAGLDISADRHEERQRLLDLVGAEADSGASDVTGAGRRLLNEGKNFLKGLAPDLVL